MADKIDMIHDDIKYVRSTVERLDAKLDVHIDSSHSMDKRLAKVEVCNERQRWLSRTILGTMIVSAVAWLAAMIK
jgi:hypothetical protein